MQPATASIDLETDFATTVVKTMRQLGVVGLPRNYEIFYEALSGSNHDLSVEVVSLSKRPRQEDLDRIGQKFFAHNHGPGIVEHARAAIARELEEIVIILRAERNHLEKYGKILDQTADGLDSRSVINKELMQKIIGVMAVATNSTIENGRQVVTTLGDKSAELESVKSKLEEYKKLADTDPLTHLCNRRAFDKAIARIYDNSRGVLFNALVLVDIDRFKHINDRFGHPAGDKIIQTISGVLQSSVRQDVFVARTGGEEFALILDGPGEDAIFSIADRLRLLIEQTPLVDRQKGGHSGSVTVSMGICMASEADGPEDLYSKADRALYRSKVAGRNQVTRYSALPERSSKRWMLYNTD